MNAIINNGGLAVDDRGSLRFFNDMDLSKLGIKRFYQVQNNDACDTRCFHGHKLEGKYVYCVKGSAIVVAVQMGAEPDTGKPSLSLQHGAGKTERFVLSALQPKILYIPPGMANGFRTIEKDTILMFFSTSSLEESKGDDYRFTINQHGYDPFNVEIR